MELSNNLFSHSRLISHDFKPNYQPRQSSSLTSHPYSPVRLWYLEPGKAFGFADRSELRTDRRRGADTAEGQLRVSWHLDGHGGPVAAVADNKSPSIADGFLEIGVPQ